MYWLLSDSNDRTSGINVLTPDEKFILCIVKT